MTASDIIDEPSRSESPTVAVVGCGYWGKNLVRNFHGLGALAAVCDNDPEQGRRIADEYSVPLRAYDDVLADPDIAGVVIATPAVDHARLVKAAILQGKHVFVEKPLALALSDAAELCDLAAAHERILMVGHLLRYHPAFLRLREICSVPSDLSASLRTASDLVKILNLFHYLSYLLTSVDLSEDGTS